MRATRQVVWQEIKKAKLKLKEIVLGIRAEELTFQARILSWEFSTHFWEFSTHFPQIARQLVGAQLQNIVYRSFHTFCYFLPCFNCVHLFVLPLSPFSLANTFPSYLEKRSTANWVRKYKDKLATNTRIPGKKTKKSKIPGKTNTRYDPKVDPSVLNEFATVAFR